MGAEDRWVPPGKPDQSRKKKGTKCSACHEGTCHACVQEDASQRPCVVDAVSRMDSLHKRPWESLRSLEFFYAVWQLVSRPDIRKKECVICIEEHPLERFTLIQCGHFFCNPCFDLATQSKKNCPMCRDPIVREGVARVEVLRKSKPPDPARTSMPSAPGRFSKYGSKLQEIVQALESVRALEPEAKVILFTQWQSLETKIASAFTEFGITYLRLTTCRDLFEKRRVVEAFQDMHDGQASVLLLSLDGHASGTNLTCASHVFLVHPMVATTAEQQVAYERQAVGRAARLGQTKVVKVWRFMTEGTLEEAVSQAPLVSSAPAPERASSPAPARRAPAASSTAGGVAQLIAMGFDAARARQALEAVSGNLEAAASSLLGD